MFVEYVVKEVVKKELIEVNYKEVYKNYIFEIFV